MRIQKRVRTQIYWFIDLVSVSNIGDSAFVDINSDNIEINTGWSLSTSHLKRSSVHLIFLDPFVLIRLSPGGGSKLGPTLFLFSLTTFLLTSGLNLVSWLVTKPFTHVSIVNMISLRSNWWLTSQTIYTLLSTGAKNGVLILTPSKLNSYLSERLVSAFPQHGWYWRPPHPQESESLRLLGLTFIKWKTILNSLIDLLRRKLVQCVVLDNIYLQDRSYISISLTFVHA